MLIVTIQSIYNGWIVVIYGYIAYDRLIVIDSGWIMLWPHVVRYTYFSVRELSFSQVNLTKKVEILSICYDTLRNMRGYNGKCLWENYGKCSNKMDVPSDFNQTTLEISTTNVIFLGRVWIPRIRIPPIHGSLNKDNYE